MVAAQKAGLHEVPIVVVEQIIRKLWSLALSKMFNEMILMQ